MPRSSLDPTSAKPFEVKVGVGFAAFGGMYRLGDPSMCPPNRFRRLINVRLGDKDVVSRPGLTTAFNSGQSDPVMNIMEIFKSDFAGVWVGPIAGNFQSNAAGTSYKVALFVRLDVNSKAFGSQLLVWTTNPPGFQRYYMLMELPAIAANAATDPDYTKVYPVQNIALAPCWHLPEHLAMLGAAQALVQPDAGEAVSPDEDGYARIGNLTGYKQAGEAVRTIAAVQYGNNFGSRLQSLPDPNVPGLFLWGSFPRERYGVNCMDTMVAFNGIFLAAGNYRGDQWPAALEGGQPVYEIVFDNEKQDPPDYYPPALDTSHFFGGTLREVFRMPGTCVAERPLRAAGGLDGRLIRSMVSRTIRNDNPLNAVEGTKDKLYIGTYGGYPDATAGGTFARGGVNFLRPYGWTKTNGEVYSFDGTTLTLETTGLGPCVATIVLPDGAVLAAGLTAAKMLNPQTGAWTAVTVPAPTQHPWSVNAVIPPAGNFDLIYQAADDAEWIDQGFLWVDRILFQGQAYFTAWDLAVLNHLFYSTALEHPADAGTGRTYWHYGTQAFVIFRFDRATMTMVEVRRGTAIWTQLKAALGANFDPRTGANEDDAKKTMLISGVLGTDGTRLYYSHSWRRTDNLGSPPPHLSFVGSFDGSTWDDDTFYNQAHTGTSQWGPTVAMASAANACFGFHETKNPGATAATASITKLTGSVLTRLDTTAFAVPPLWGPSPVKFSGLKAFLGPK